MFEPSNQEVATSSLHETDAYDDTRREHVKQQ